MHAFTSQLSYLASFGLVTCTVRNWRPDSSRATVVCLHSFTGNGADFGLLGQWLAKLNIATISVDLPGRGESTFLGKREHYSLKMQIELVRRIATSCEPPIFLLGSSWGASIMAALASFKGFACSGLILVDGAIADDARDQSDYEIALQDEALFTFTTFEAARLYFVLTRQLAHLAEEEIVEILKCSLHKADGKWRLRYDPCLSGILGVKKRPFSFIEPLRLADFPILYLGGESSFVWRSKKHRADRNMLPNMKIVSFPYESHPLSLAREEHCSEISDFVVGTIS